MCKPSVVTEADQLEVDTRVSQELKLLDVGCGTGNYLNAVHRLLGSCSGLEFNEGMLAQAQAKEAVLQAEAKELKQQAQAKASTS